MQEVSLITNNQVDVIIASQNAGNALLKCIDNLLLLENLGEIIVTNNGISPSDEILINQIAKTNSKVRLLPNYGDIGFAKACNVGMGASTAPFLLFLQADCIISDSKILYKLVDSIESGQYKVATCLILNRDDQVRESCRRHLLTPLIIINECLGLHKLCSKFKKINLPLKDIENLSEISEVQALSSAVIFTTKEYLQRLGGFDESYFYGVEDLDLSMRIKINGDKIAFIKNIAVKHSLPDGQNELLEVYKARGFVIYIKKFFPKFNNIILASCLKILISLRYIFTVYSMRKTQKNL